MVAKPLDTLGILFVSQNHTCFFSKLLNRKIKAVISFDQISQSEKQKLKVVISYEHGKKRKLFLRFKHESIVEEAVGLMDSLIKSKSVSSAPVPDLSALSLQINAAEEEFSDLDYYTSSTLRSWLINLSNQPTGSPFSMTQGDWDSILRGARMFAPLPLPFSFLLLLS
jgi:hypothetical protein